MPAEFHSTNLRVGMIVKVVRHKTGLNGLIGIVNRYDKSYPFGPRVGIEVDNGLAVVWVFETEIVILQDDQEIPIQILCPF
jgi:hypothetical protein